MCCLRTKRISSHIFSARSSARISNSCIIHAQYVFLLFLLFRSYFSSFSYMHAHTCRHFVLFPLPQMRSLRSHCFRFAYSTLSNRFSSTFAYTYTMEEKMKCRVRIVFHTFSYFHISLCLSVGFAFGFSGFRKANCFLNPNIFCVCICVGVFEEYVLSKPVNDFPFQVAFAVRAFSKRKIADNLLRLWKNALSCSKLSGPTNLCPNRISFCCASFPLPESL